MPFRFFLKPRLYSNTLVLISISAGLALVSAPAKAGFQWVSPTETTAGPPSAASPNNYGAPPVESVPPLMPAPEAPVTRAPTGSTPLAGEGPEVISPIVIEGSMPAAPSSPHQLGALPLSPSSSDAIVQGFANNVPLAVALREILPSGYGYSIDQDVDLGTLVSFQGGKPWRETLQATLQPAGLVMREQNEMVAISHSTSANAGSGVVAPPPEVAAIPMTASAPPPVYPPLTAYPSPSSSSMQPNPPPPWPGPAAAYGPKPALAQPVVSFPPAPPAPPPVASSRMSSTSIVDTWTASRGDTLHKVLGDWSRRAGAEFEWDAEYDYPLQASISYTGTFEEAVRNLLSGFEDAHPQPVAELHANPGAGQMVLVVQTRGNSYTD